MKRSPRKFNVILFFYFKVIWVCILCRKKQELLIKTGQWLHSGMAAKQRAMEAGEESPTDKDGMEKRPKLERAHSEGKENVTQSSFGRGMSRRGSLQQLHRTNSQRELRRQFSQEREPPKPEDVSDHQRAYPDRSDRSLPEVKRIRAPDVSARDNFSRLRSSGQDLRDSRRWYDGTSDPSYDRQKDRYLEPSSHRHSRDSIIERDTSWKDGHQKSRDGYMGGDRRYTIRDQQWLSQEDERTAHSDSAAFSRRISQESLRDHSERSHRDTRLIYAREEDWKDSSKKRDYEVLSDDTRLRFPPIRTGDDRRNHLEPGYTSDSRGRGHNNRKKVESVVRNDSLSSDQSESVRPPPPKPHKNKRGRKLRQKSLSSSDDEIRSTPECSSCEERDAESESISEKGMYIPFLCSIIHKGCPVSLY